MKSSLILWDMRRKCIRLFLASCDLSLDRDDEKENLALAVRVVTDAAISEKQDDVCDGKRAPENLDWDETTTKVSLISTLLFSLTKICIEIFTYLCL